MSERTSEEQEPGGVDETAGFDETWTPDEADGDQLPREDTLQQRGVDDLLDEGYSPHDRPRPELYDETPLDQEVGETIDRELSEEEPEDDDAADDGPRTLHDLLPDGADPRAGRLAEDDDALEGRRNDVFADDEGVAGGAASAEEAAVHLVGDREAEYQEDVLDALTDSEDDDPEDALG